MLGPTFSWIVAEQFRALKDGDRFFFTHSNAGGLPRPIQVRAWSSAGAQEAGLNYARRFHCGSVTAY